eukprot:CAMPEP_0177630100 /NCGR_PEP_ID=MMETSP0447-20121125/1028_1 /TAXON_ID=0 /ORGANISM="Stygamoeba regulata, Strain BSH-02190019" /LENGTH=192 /DNA_ID=CAMNT_0019131479 /DNA_START=541 /DNA_END=1120 /DNA_ORIENTATION=-
MARGPIVFVLRVRRDHHAGGQHGIQRGAQLLPPRVGLLPLAGAAVLPVVSGGPLAAFAQGQEGQLWHGVPADDGMDTCCRSDFSMSPGQVASLSARRLRFLGDAVAAAVVAGTLPSSLSPPAARLRLLLALRRDTDELRGRDGSSLSVSAEGSFFLLLLSLPFFVLDSVLEALLVCRSTASVLIDLAATTGY